MMSQPRVDRPYGYMWCVLTRCIRVESSIVSAVVVALSGGAKGLLHLSSCCCQTHTAGPLCWLQSDTPSGAGICVSNIDITHMASAECPSNKSVLTFAVLCCVVLCCAVQA